MKKIILAIACFLSFTAFTSCGDLFETSGNGDLDGQWMLTQIDTLASGTSVNLVGDRKFLAVQGKILIVFDSDEDKQYMFRFTHSDNQLTLSDARLNDRERNDSVVSDVALLRPFGINSLTERFTVESLSGSKMVLTSNLLRLFYKKF